MLTVWHKWPSKESLLYKSTTRKHTMKFRQIGHTTSLMDSRFFPFSAWNGLAFAEAPSLAVFR